jgi:hypothetical protein
MAMSADATHDTGPVTALVQPVEVAVSPPPGFWQRDASHMPNPLSPMYRSLLPHATESFRGMFDRFGFLVETVACAEIGGWGYVRVVPLGGRIARLRRVWCLPSCAGWCRRSGGASGAAWRPCARMSRGAWSGNGTNNGSP